MAKTMPFQKDNSGFPQLAHAAVFFHWTLAAVLYGPTDIRIEERPLTPPGPGEVQVRIRQTGLCGSDLHYFLHGRNGDFELQAPLVLGHEAAGEIVAVGPAHASSERIAALTGAAPASSLSIGQRVAIEAGQPCAACMRCVQGRYNLCPGMRFASSAKTFPHLDGTLTRYLNWPSSLVHILPDSISYRSGAILEPLCVVLQAFKRAHLEPTDRVLVMGAGAVGLLACAAAKARGCHYVVAVDIDEGRLSFARENGWADKTVVLAKPAASASGPPSNAEQMIQSRTMAQSILDTATDAEGGFDAVIECTGVMSCVQGSIFATRPGGRVVLVGMGTPIQTLPIGAASLREVDLIGVFRYAQMYPDAIKLISSGALSSDGSEQTGVQGSEERKRRMGGIEGLASHVYALEDTALAFETLAAGKDAAEGRGVVKVFVVDESP